MLGNAEYGQVSDERVTATATATARRERDTQWRPCI
jgi:hypothetical protein